MILEDGEGCIGFGDDNDEDLILDFFGLGL